VWTGQTAGMWARLSPGDVRISMKRFLLAARVGLALAAPSFAQQAGALTYTLTGRPAHPPTRALKYTLMPELKDMTKGNALLHYYKSFSTEWWSNINRQNVQWHENADKAQQAALDKL